jgi:hypothetical protein
VTYATVEVAVQTLIQAMSEFDDADVSRGNYLILDSGDDDLAVLTPGSFTKDEPGEAGAYKSVRHWSVLVDLFRKYLDDETTWINFVATRDALLDHLELYPSLNSTAGIVLVGVEAGSDPSEVYDDDDNGPFFIFQRIRMAVNERTDLAGGEYTT